MLPKVWRIFNEAGAFEVVVFDGQIVQSEIPFLAQLPWPDARQVCIDRGWHGQRFPDSLSHAGLKRRGWTDKLIKKYLVEPCRVETNPHHPGGRAMRCYDILKVEHYEAQSPEIQQSIQELPKRRRSA